MSIPNNPKMKTPIKKDAITYTTIFCKEYDSIIDSARANTAIVKGKKSIHPSITRTLCFIESG
jgi:hypothetical protein